MTVKTENIVVAIDDAVLEMLKRVKGDDGYVAKDLLVEHVKAVDAAVKWAQARGGLLPKDDAPASKFVNMKRVFHEPGRTPRGRRSSSAAAFEERSADNVVSITGTADASDAGEPDED